MKKHAAISTLAIALLPSISVMAEPQTKLFSQATGSILTKNADPNFPLRDAFTHVKTVDTATLIGMMDKVKIIDVRSAFEHEVMSIAGSDSIEWPITSIIGGKEHQAFADKVVDAYKNTGKTIVFYCNGPTCAKSFDAANFIRERVDNNVLVYDAGIKGWVKSNLDKTFSFGHLLNKEALITDEQHKAHTLNAIIFMERAGARKEAIVIDLRAKPQTMAISLFPGREVWTGLDIVKIKDLVKEAKDKGVPVYLYDFLGLQTQSVQYLLEHEGLKDYFFMEGGTSGKKGYFDSLGA